MLAEFLVAKAVGDQRPLRIGWDNFDVVAPDGTTIEVKCSAFLQSWPQKRHSELVFGRLTAREFDYARNEYSVDARVRADVFVFAVQTQRDRQPMTCSTSPTGSSGWPARAPSGSRQSRPPASAGCVSTPLDRSFTAGWPMPSTRRHNCVDDGRFNAPTKALTCRCGCEPHRTGLTLPGE
jgi:hypothetical protein